MVKSELHKSENSCFQITKNGAERIDLCYFILMRSNSFW